jgi:hypothetical protein
VRKALQRDMIVTLNGKGKAKQGPTCVFNALMEKAFQPLMMDDLRFTF